MKTILHSLTIFTSLTLLSFGAHAQEEVAKSKAAELALHRIERLVILNRIDAGFQTQFKRLTLRDAEANNENIRFDTTSTQFATTSTPHTVNIYLDPTGRAVRHDTVMQTPPTGAPTWGPVDPVTLAENSLHYVQENWQAKPELAPFHRAFIDLTIVPGTGTGGVAAGVVDIHSSETNQTLRVFIRQADGAFDSATIL